MLARMDSPVPQLTLPSARQHAPGLWLATAPLAAAAGQAPAEALALAAGENWAPARRESFLAGRAVAAQALRALGAPAWVAREADGRPRWPAGTVGSIAHGGGHAVAVAGRATAWAAAGVDVEPDAPLPADAAAMVLREEDQTGLAEAFGAAAASHARLVFCAKECVHKALHPWCGAWLEFDEVRIAWPDGAASRRWQALPVSGAARQAFAGASLIGEWWRADGALWALLTVRNSG
jgi:4'-phosphopantetheinyl transferase EntD